jgi:MFS family permease
LIFAYGFLSDKVGRKITSIVLLSVATVSLLLLYLGAMNHWNEWLLGAFIGLFLAAYWSNGDTYMLMAGESCPTNIRASVMSAWTAAYGVGMVLSMLVGTLVTKHLPDGNVALGLFDILLAAPFFVLSIFFLLTKVKETKGAHLEDALSEEKTA